jgi:hypothetical protein
LTDRTNDLVVRLAYHRNALHLAQHQARLHAPSSSTVRRDLSNDDVGTFSWPPATKAEPKWSRATEFHRQLIVRLHEWFWFRLWLQRLRLARCRWRPFLCRLRRYRCRR